MKMSFVIIVLNGMPFLKAALESIYKSAHEIIIVEGAVKKARFSATKDGHSIDGTISFIKKFKDDKNKIKLMSPGFWEDKCSMQNAGLKEVTGNYVWLVDSDEVYKKKDIEKIIQILKEDSTITQINVPMLHFWKDYDHIISSDILRSKGVARIFKFEKGNYFSTHRPPTLKSKEKSKIIEKDVLENLEIYCYHYSYILPMQVKQKLTLYKLYGWEKPWKIDLDDWYSNCFAKWTIENKDKIEEKYGIWTCDKNSKTEKFLGVHPKSMRCIMDLIMQNLKSAITVLKKRFPNILLNCVETGTIRSYTENHNSTLHIAEVLGKNGSLISIDVNPKAIKISKVICKAYTNIKWILGSSVPYFNSTKEKFHFVFLDSQNNKEFIFEEFRLVISKMLLSSILIVDDAGVDKNGKIDMVQGGLKIIKTKGHKIAPFLSSLGIVNFVRFNSRGTSQLWIDMNQNNLSLIKEGLKKL